ncbi:uncharacterized protein LOC143252648 [Tachypleus tridentatus]|uniref:uncharacterized protein LOC143252648 n=1 Tax=Tachypleus tridentatus TaxID=6853 RepID=UPI003FD2EE57
MKFAIPSMWCEPTDHSSNFYFCMVGPSKRWACKNASAIMYPDLPSSIAPVPYCPKHPVLTLPERKQSSSEEEVDVEDPDYNFRGAAGERNPYYPNQKDLDTLIRDLGLAKSNAKTIHIWELIRENDLHYSRKSRETTHF